MAEGEPPEPDLPNYLLEPLQKQPAHKLEVVAEYATDLAAWKRHQREAASAERRAEDEIDEEHRHNLKERDISIHPADYRDVPNSGAYITVKTTKETDDTSYRYFYWQWREGDSWKNEYIAPVNPTD